MVRAADTTCKSEEVKFCKGMTGTALAKCLGSHKTDLSESCQVTLKTDEAAKAKTDLKKEDPLKGMSPADKASAIFNP